MLDSIYHMQNTLKTLSFCHYVRNVVMDVIISHYKQKLSTQRPVDPSTCRPVGSFGSLEYTILGTVNAATRRPVGTLGCSDNTILGTVNVSTCRPVDS